GHRGPGAGEGPAALARVHRDVDRQRVAGERGVGLPVQGLLAVGGGQPDLGGVLVGGGGGGGGEGGAQGQGAQPGRGRPAGAGGGVRGHGAPLRVGSRAGRRRPPPFFLAGRGVVRKRAPCAFFSVEEMRSGGGCRPFWCGETGDAGRFRPAGGGLEAGARGGPGSGAAECAPTAAPKALKVLVGVGLVRFFEWGSGGGGKRRAISPGRPDLAAVPVGKAAETSSGKGVFGR